MSKIRKTMKSLFLFLFSLLLSFSSFAQMEDTFSDGNFTENPSWQGDIANFIVNTAKELQLNAPAAGVSSLYTAVNVTDSCVWEFNIRLGFAPSSSNVLKIYLQSSSNNFDATNGYYLSIGENGNADALKFYRQNGATSTLLSSGTAGAVANDPTKARIKITRSALGNWSIFADYTGNIAYKLESTTQDNTFLGGANYAGFKCLYTATRTDKFFFDDIKIGIPKPDLQAPKLLSIKVLSKNKLDLTFDEALDATTAQKATNYTINNGINSPSNAALDNANANLVHLTLITPLATNSYQLTTSNLTDLSNNVSGTQTFSFDYLEVVSAAPYDILINEMMVDPTPVVGLPDAEYVELYNRSNKTINLEGYQLSNANGTTVVFPSYVLGAKKYLIVYKNSATAKFKPYGDTLALSNFFGLVNTGDALTLINADDEIIDFASYDISTYKDSKKSDGGWSLERINPNAPCAGAENWTASSAALVGGTPGKANAVLVDTPDNIPPIALLVYPQSTTQIKITFDKAVNSVTMQNLSNYSFTPSILSAEVLAPKLNEVLLTLSQPLEKGKKSQLLILSVTDCTGNASSKAQDFDVLLPDEVSTGDLQISELLFHPQSGGYDFIELQNISTSKSFNIKNLQLLNTTNNKSETIANDFILNPGQYVVLTNNPEDIKGRYTVPNPAALLKAKLPNLDISGGKLNLFQVNQGVVMLLDSISFDEKNHSPLLADPVGVSLERVAGVWISATKASGYGTPTGPNSNQPSNAPVGQDIFNVPTTFSPDDDGDNDLLQITYKDNAPETQTTIHIYDMAGRIVKHLVKNETLSNMGELYWYGDTDTGARARVGLYIVWIKYFSLDGTVNAEQKVVALLRKG